MPLTSQQRAALEAAAKERGVDPAALIAEAERLASAPANSGDAPSKDKGAADGATSSSEPPKLFQYHLPFVRVREVRKIWLGLDEAFPGDDEIAAEWAAKHGAGGAGGTPPDGAPA